MGLKRYGSLKNFNQKHPAMDADTDTRVTTIALPVLHRGELRMADLSPLEECWYYLPLVLVASQEQLQDPKVSNFPHHSLLLGPKIKIFSKTYI